MTPAQFVHTLQLTDSFFPVGAFAYSDGLETAAATGRVHDVDSLAGWIDHFLHAVFAPCEGLALLKCMRAIENGDWAVVSALDEELTALKPAAATRASSQSMGKRLLTTYAATVEDGSFEMTSGIAGPCNAPIAYAIVFAHRRIDRREALLGYGYMRLAGMISAGLRLIAIGQQQGQILLNKELDRLTEVTEQILQRETEPLRSFSPLMDVEQMNHHYLYSKLFRS